MAEKDMTEKMLESYNDVFADIVNVLLFDGKEVLIPDELADAVPRSVYKSNSKLHEMERDTAKRWLRKNIRIAFIGFENQTSSDPDMPIRIIAYDGAEYRAQLIDKELKERYPVITLVLYFGYKKHWDKPLNLAGCLNIPEEFKPYVSNYGMNLFEIAYLSDEKVNMFKSDFRIVADYFVQMRKNNNYIPSAVEMKHVQEVLHLMSVMTGDRRFEEVCNSEIKEGGNITMCEVLDKIESRGIAKGREEGIREGREEGITEMLKKYMKKIGCSADAAMEDFDIPMSERNTFRLLLE